MRLLHTSDWHLGKSLYEFSLLEDQRHFITRLVDLIDRERVEAVAIAGDIFDRPVPPSAAVELFDDFLTAVCVERGVPVLAIAGNHDGGSRLEFGSRLYRAGGYHIAGKPQKDAAAVTLRDSYGDIEFWLIPYLHPADMRAALEDASVRTFQEAYRALVQANRPRMAEGRRRVALAHGFFSQLGEDRGELLYSDSEINIGGIDIADIGLFGDFDYIALGHLHCPQWVSPGRARYSGSPLAYSLSEQNGAKSVTLVELGPKGEVNCEIREISPLRAVRTVKGSLAGLLDLSWHANTSFEDYVFAELEGREEAYAMEKLRHVFPNLLGLSFPGRAQTDRIEARAELKNARLTTEELFRRFYRDMRGEELPQEYLELLRSLPEHEEVGV